MARPRKNPEVEKPASELAQRVNKGVDNKNAWITALAAIRTVVDQLLKSALEESEVESTKLDNGIDALHRATQILAGAHGLEVAPVPTANGKAAKKEKKEKKVKDPNEPKRPATPYILFGQHARPTVKKDLGEDAKPKAVENEITQRWNSMDAAEKQAWKDAYERNKESYGLLIADYKAGKTALANGTTPAPEDSDVADAEGEVEAEAAAGADDDSSSASSDTESEKEPTPPPAPEAKTPKSNKRRKVENGATSTPVPLPSASKAAAPTPKVETPAPAKKRRGPKTKAEKAAIAEAEAAEKAAAEAAAAPASEKKNKRKRKSEGAAA